MSDKYRRVRTSTERVNDENKPLNEIRVSAKGRTSVYISYASSLWAPTNPQAKDDEDPDSPKLDPKTGKPFTSLTFKATGAALSTVVTVVEIVKRRFKGVEQITKLGSFELDDVYEPVDKSSGLENMVQKRAVSFIEITLSRKKGELDVKDKGYQPPLPDSEIEELSVEEMLNPRSRRNKEGDDADEDDDEDEKPKKGKGKGKKGKGKGKSKGKGKGSKGSKGKGKGKGKSKGEGEKKSKASGKKKKEEA